MATPQIATGNFPPQLDQVNVNEQIAQSFGWLPGYCGVLLVAFCAWGAAIQHRDGWWSDPRNLALVAGAGVLGALLIWWEFRRRTQPTVLVPRNGMIGIYRGGQLAQAIAPAQMRFYKLHWFNTARLVIVPAIAGGILLLVPLFDSPRTTTGDERLLQVMGLGILVAVASGVRTRIMLEHWYIPRGKRTQEIMLKKNQSRRVLSGQA